MPKKRSSETQAEIQRGKRPAKAQPVSKKHQQQSCPSESELPYEEENIVRDSGEDLLDDNFAHAGYGQIFREKFQKRTVMPLKPLPRTFDIEINFGIYAKFERLGWHKFMEYDMKEVYPALVKIFYTHFQHTDDGNEIRSWVKGKEIVLTKTMFNSWFGLQPGVHCIYTSSEIVKVENVDPLEMLKFVIDDDTITEFFKPQKKHLPLVHKVLQAIIMNNIVPHSGGRDSVTYFEVFLIWAIMHEYPIDLATIVFGHMIVCFKSKTASLPYGLFMTFIFGQFGVPYWLKNTVEPIDRRLIFSSSLLSNMGYELNSRREWVLCTQTMRSMRRGRIPEPRAREATAPESVQEEDMQSQSAVYPGELLAMLEGLQVSINTGFAESKARITSLSEEVQKQFHQANERIVQMEGTLAILQDRGTQTNDMMDRRLGRTEATPTDLLDTVQRVGADLARRQQQASPSPSYYSDVFPRQPPPHGRR